MGSTQILQTYIALGLKLDLFEAMLEFENKCDVPGYTHLHFEEPDFCSLEHFLLVMA